MGSAKPVAPEEKKRRIDEIEAMRKSKRDFDKFLSEKLGLNF